MSGDENWHDHLSERIIAAIIRVHQVLGPGFVEKIYHRALIIELRRMRLNLKIEQSFPIVYEGVVVGRHEVDLIVESQIIVELKAAPTLGREHYAQVRSYLRATSLSRAILVNFSKDRADFRRITSPFIAISPQ